MPSAGWKNCALNSGRAWSRPDHLKSSGSFPDGLPWCFPGGGAQGAYEAGVLQAFQDAGVTTHIITATSVGSINAASYAAHSGELVGKAEPLVDSWFGLSPVAVGIEWTRYAWVLAGLVATSAGFGNLMRTGLAEQGFTFLLHNAMLTWLLLGLAGIAVLLFYDSLPYLGYVLGNLVRGSAWQPARGKLWISVAANVLMGGFIVVLLHSLYVENWLVEWSKDHAVLAAVGIGLLALAVSALSERLRTRVGSSMHGGLRLALRAGLFPNFERTRYLRARIPVAGLRASPMRVLFAATDLETAAARFFSNTPPTTLVADRGADRRFIETEVAEASDPILAVVAASALPIAYEPLRLGGRLYTDGGIVTNQPIRPAIRLGADVLFLVLVEPQQTRRGEVKTFVDVGLRALDILMMQNFLTDVKILSGVNDACERAAATIGLRPERVEIDLGSRRYRYVKAFTIRPPAPLAGTSLDFTGVTIDPAIVQGYCDACLQIETALAYLPWAPFGQPKQVLRLTPERGPVE